MLGVQGLHSGKLGAQRHGVDGSVALAQGDYFALVGDERQHLAKAPDSAFIHRMAGDATHQPARPQLDRLLFNRGVADIEQAATRGTAEVGRRVTGRYLGAASYAHQAVTF